MKRLASCALALAGMTLPLHAQGTQGGTLVSNQESDAFDIADQLYAQTRVTNMDPAARAQLCIRAAQLYGDFVRRFPNSSRKNKALYLQAVCYEEAGEHTAAQSCMESLATRSQGEYAAAAAYKLATAASSRKDWSRADRYYGIAASQTRRSDLRNDALYRQGRALMLSGQRQRADAIFTDLTVRQREVKPNIWQASMLSLAQMKIEDGDDHNAYGLFRRLLEQPNLDQNIAGMATLQAARLGARLGFTQESQELYNKLAGMPGMEKYSGEAQMETLLQMYRSKDYQGVINLVQNNLAQMDEPLKDGQRALIVGQSYMELKRYDRAAEWFAYAQEVGGNSSMGADAAYRRIVCVQQQGSPSFYELSEKYLNTYAVQGRDTADLPCTNLVRLMYADRLMLTQVDASARQFDALNIDKLPESVQADALYKRAWTAAQGDVFDPVPPLNEFIEKYREDQRMPEALTLRGKSLVKQGKIDQGLQDFDRVIREYPKASVVPVCWQQAAQACVKKNDRDRMAKYYQGLIDCGGQVSPAAIAEAHYNIASLLLEKDAAKAVEHFQEASRQYPDHYGPLVDHYLVWCYFKMQRADLLLQGLRTLESRNAATYQALPASIPLWCGWMCFQSGNFADADKYLSDAVARSPKETYTKADGTKGERNRVEPLVWKTLAKARLELGRYPSGLEAAEHYVSMEKRPYPRAEGMRDEAMLLIGLGRTADARKVCEEAITMGVDGPIKSTLFIALGDAYYADRNYTDAAKYYGRTANVVSDKDLKPLSLYKITCALKKCGKVAEANQYEDMLKKDFPDWKPSESVLKMMGEASPASRN